MAHIELTKEQWREVHNAMCELFSAGQHIEVLLDQFKGDPHKRLVDAINKVNHALKPARHQDNWHEERLFEIARDVQVVNGFDAEWSILEPEVTDFNALHPFSGAEFVQYKDNIGKPVQTPIEGDRWVDLYQAADKAIKLSRDAHHIFIEAFEQLPEHPEMLKLHTGS